MKWLWQQSARWTLVSALIREKIVLYALLGFSFVYLAFSFFGISIWRCAWEAVTCWRWPGCGLTRGCQAFLKGDFTQGLAWNWLTPAVLLGLLLFPVMLALPKSLQEKFLQKLEWLEKRFRLVLLLLILLVAQTIARWQGWA